MRYKKILICLANCLLIQIVLFASGIITNYTFAQLSIDSVYPNAGNIGQSLNVTVKGTGFDENTRLSMSLDTGNTRHIIGSVDTPGEAETIVVVGQTAYVADGVEGLQIIDVSEPSNPIITGSVDTPDYALFATVVDQTAYVADLGSGLQVIDVSDPSSPTIIGSVDTPGEASWVSVIDQIAYVCDWGGGLQVIDVSDPSNPFIISTVDTPGGSFTATVIDQLAYVADLESGLQVIDVSDPFKPAIIGSVDTPSEAIGIKVIDQIAYVGDDESGLQIIDVSDPLSPVIIGSVDTLGSASIVDVLDHIAYVADWGNGLQVIDVSNPASPVIIGSVDTPGPASGVMVLNKTAYVANMSRGVQVIDISEPANLSVVGSADTPGYAVGITIIGETAYVADGESGVVVMDVSDPSEPVVIGQMDTSGYAYHITVVGSTAYIADGENGVLVMDMSDPSTPVVIGQMDTSGYAYHITVVGPTAYVADGENGVLVIDVTDPNKPFIISSVDTPGEASVVDVVDHIAYVADWEQGLQIIDVSNSVRPEIIGAVDTPGYATLLTVVDDYVYVADDYTGLQIIDVRNPFNPIIIGSVKTPGEASGVTIVDQIAYVANNYSGLQVIDVSVPSQPAITGSIYTPGNAFHVEVINQTAYVADGRAGLSIVPVPKEIAKVEVEDSTTLQVDLLGPKIPGHYNMYVFNDLSFSQLYGAVSFLSTKEHTIQGHKKAIIAAGGTIDDRLSEAAKKCSNLAYLVLLSQGYVKEKIRYLSPHNFIDADGDGQNDVSGICTSETISKAIQEWAAQDASELLIYLIDHGGHGTFQANQGDIIKAEDLDYWLDKAQSTIPGAVVLIYDACYSGSFLPLMTAPKERQRFVITSSAANEETWFMEGGVMSFGYQFWSSLFLNANLCDSYQVARGMIENSQTPILDADGDAQETHKDIEIVSDFTIGRGRIAASNPPKIGSVNKKKILSGEVESIIWASGIKSLNNLKSVWAVVIPPDYENTYVGRAVTELDSVQLLDADGDGIYTGDYKHFKKQGTYKISVYAEDVEGSLALPKTTEIIQTFGDPICDIKQNNTNYPITINSSDPVTITISLSPGNRTHKFCDWWIAAFTPNGWKSLIIEPQVVWVDGLRRTIVMPLAEISEIQIPQPPLYEGKNFIFFAIDDNADAIPDATWGDYVEVSIQ